MKKIITITIFILCVGSFNLCFAMPIISTFDVDGEGWAVSSGGSITHRNPGGNPDGFLEIEDIAGDTYVVMPPSKFKGNLLEFNRGLISYDVIVIDPAEPLASVGSGFGRIQIEGGGSNATFDYAPNPPIPSSEFWKTYYVPMTADAWNTTEQNWAAILSDVNNIYIILEPKNWSTVGLDNFQIAPIPEPATLSLFGLGLLGFALRKKA